MWVETFNFCIFIIYNNTHLRVKKNYIRTINFILRPFYVDAKTLFENGVFHPVGTGGTQSGPPRRRFNVLTSAPNRCADGSAGTGPLRPFLLFFNIWK